ncbi:MAG: hypothetical protein WC876_10655, partial [Candidatus Thermoplasmatota archaeon]
MTFRQDGSASAQTISLVVAAAIFMSAVSAVLLLSRSAGDDRAAADEATQDIEATSLADLLVGSAGVGWASGPDDLERLGLGASNGSGLQDSSILALKGAMEQSMTNGKVDYADAQASLGIDPAGTQEFHIRMYPVGMSTVYDSSLSGIRVAYIADFTSLANVVVPLGTPQSLYAAQANAQLNLTMGPSTVFERQAIRDLGLAFTDRIYITSASPSVVVDMLAPLPDVLLLTALGVPSLAGDVYPDIKSYLDANLPSRLAQYDIIIVGSGVEHSSLTANAVKDGIRDWVLAGGMLVMMGS